ncbi:phage tail protein X [Tepidimonas ignava]|uniref:Phage tail protein X n=1 Tax=Tepidimonas ignava TaxID=114249 RepID=A0A4R3L384_9BURK|nr:tail protein X [Tepidimonas ignava]TCS94131.1 phage tail protein X [Tepidimonas ignava]TSE18957.1 Phage Tail Protein X [Tepidimonas ignava]
MSTYTTQRDGERLDLICWRWYGTLSGRVLERVLDANPGLAARNPAALPSGTVISMPDAPAQPAPAARVF